MTEFQVDAAALRAEAPGVAALAPGALLPGGGTR